MKNKRKIFLIRRGFSLLTVFLFTAAVTVLGALFFIMPKKEVSDVEKRKLTSMPSFTADSLLSGEFTDGLSIYYSDNFAFRDELVKLSFELEDMRGIRYGDVKIY